MARKYLPLDEFVSSGLLQEINRRLLHPMGLALEVTAEADGKICSISGIWDIRDDPEGIAFGDGGPDPEKARNVNLMFESKIEARVKNLGYHIQPAGDVK